MSGAAKCPHRKDPDDVLGYVAKSLAAERRLKRGEKQRLCPVCKLWFWERLFHHDSR